MKKQNSFVDVGQHFGEVHCVRPSKVSQLSWMPGRVCGSALGPSEEIAQSNVGGGKEVVINRVRVYIGYSNLFLPSCRTTEAESQLTNLQGAFMRLHYVTFTLGILLALSWAFMAAALRPWDLF